MIVAISTSKMFSTSNSLYIPAVWFSNEMLLIHICCSSICYSIYTGDILNTVWIVNKPLKLISLQFLYYS